MERVLRGSAEQRATTTAAVAVGSETWRSCRLPALHRTALGFLLCLPVLLVPETTSHRDESTTDKPAWEVYPRHNTHAGNSAHHLATSAVSPPRPCAASPAVPSAKPTTSPPGQGTHCLHYLTTYLLPTYLPTYLTALWNSGTYSLARDAPNLAVQHPALIDCLHMTCPPAACRSMMTQSAARRANVACMSYLRPSTSRSV